MTQTPRIGLYRAVALQRRASIEQTDHLLERTRPARWLPAIAFGLSMVSLWLYLRIGS